MFNTLEERGELNVPRDASGNPEDVQVVALEQIPSEEEVYAPNVSLGPPPTPPAQCADFVILRPLQYRIAETLIEMWEEGQRRIKSEDVYERVLSTGQEVPDGLMNDVLSTFEEDGVIRVQGFLGREAIKRHGAKVITCPTASLMRNDLLNTACRARIKVRKGYKDAQNGANGTRNRGR